MNLFARLHSFPASTRSGGRLLSVLAWSLAIGSSAWAASDLFWRFAAPRAVVLPVASPAEPRQAADVIASRHLLGQASRENTVAPVAAVASRFTLQAVVSGTRERTGWAVISTDGGPQQAYLEGQALSPGVSLTRVAADHVELDVSGARQTLTLTRAAASGLIRQSSTLAAQPPVPEQSSDSAD